MSKKIIVISGKQLSGKDTTANTLLECLPDFKRAALADAIKMELAEQKGLTFNEIDRNKFMYRSELITLGNKRRAEDQDYWIKKVFEFEGNLLVSDMRMKHEYETFQTLGATTIRVESSRDERASRGVITEENDSTETQLDDIKDWDYVIENDCDYESYIQKVKQLAETLKKTLFTEAK